VARLGGPNYATLGRIITQPHVGEAGPTEAAMTHLHFETRANKPSVFT